MVVSTVVEGHKYYGLCWNDNHLKTHVFSRGDTRRGSDAKVRRQNADGSTHFKMYNRPRVLEKYYRHSHIVDDHNNLRQGTLSMEGTWRTDDPWKRLMCTMIGIIAVDSYRAYNYFSPRKKYTKLMSYIEDLALELLTNRYVYIHTYMHTYIHTYIHMYIHRYMDNRREDKECNVVASVLDELKSKTHEMVKLPDKKQSRCLVCSRSFGRNRKTSFRCKTCDMAMCRDGMYKFSGQTESRSCWSHHLNNQIPKRKRIAKRRRSKNGNEDAKHSNST